MDRVSLALLNSALTTRSDESRRTLSDGEYAELAVLTAQMAQRYPSQELEQSIDGYQADFEQLALRYSLRQVRDALAELRIKPGQRFFPRPDEVAEEIEDQRERRTQNAKLSEGNKWLRDWDRHVCEVLAERRERDEAAA